MDKKEREALGVDELGRLHGVPALRSMVESAQAAREEDPNRNVWRAADKAVDSFTDDPEVTASALRYLLGLHLHDLDEDEPQVAMRNVRHGDVVRLGGTPVRVNEVAVKGRTVMVMTVSGSWAHDRDLRIPLVARPSAPPPAPPVEPGSPSDMAEKLSDFLHGGYATISTGPDSITVAENDGVDRRVVEFCLTDRMITLTGDGSFILRPDTDPVRAIQDAFSNGYIRLSWCLPEGP